MALIFTKIRISMSINEGKICPLFSETIYEYASRRHQGHQDIYRLHYIMIYIVDIYDVLDAL